MSSVDPSEEKKTTTTTTHPGLHNKRIKKSGCEREV